MARRSGTTALPLSAAFALLIVYATLYPFSGWRWPPGQSLESLLVLPWAQYYIAFDLWANFIGYMPLGALLYGAGVRSGWRWWWALLAAALLPGLMSYTLELIQNFLPERVPSREDWLLNGGGGVVGALLAAALQALGAIRGWQTLRDRWFIPASAGALTLLLLWPLGLLFPTPVPLGLGQCWDEVRELALLALEDTPWAAAVEPWLRPLLPESTPLSRPTEMLAIALGLLGPCLVAFAVMRSRARRAVLALLVLALALAVSALSTALNFGPEHALAWLTPATVPGLVLGLLAAWGCSLLPRRMAAAVGLIVLTALVAVVAQAPDNPYYAQSLQAWAQGRFIRFHGLARWIGWLWPYAAGLWLLLRIGARDDA
ncbi:VanZ family protein [Azohydromonas caseinilytica]|uniref:VanZ family protein n=1 Tax=Azohydromonas caseinilytica TaxID=2728836 RepID=A0A848FL56_9BURK|nr:VanZ family protein [Azohydromonas caseinilytica]NML18963.1 VanZ family protein [Azohydromonas caseinilytica]